MADASDYYSTHESQHRSSCIKPAIKAYTIIFPNMILALRLSRRMNRFTLVNIDESAHFGFSW